MRVGALSRLTNAAALSPRRWTPAALAPAAWWDVSDITTLWQDIAGTVPVTGNGDLVARMDDKSGTGKHFLQATASKRPAYQTSGGRPRLQYDGVDDLMTCASPIDAETSTIFLGIDTTDTGDCLAISITKQIIYASLNPSNQWGAYNMGVVLAGAPVGGTAVLGMVSRAFNDVDFHRNGDAPVTNTGGVWYNGRNVCIGADSSEVQHCAMDFYGATVTLTAEPTENVGRLKSYYAGKVGLTL